MSSATTIEWTDTTWNPTAGCDRVSPGCDHCYALTMAKRLRAMGSTKYQNDGDPRTSGPGFGVATHANSLLDPVLRWPQHSSKRVFVNSMSDLFHARVPVEFTARVFATMALTPQHTYQILTKRPTRMRKLLLDEQFTDAMFDALLQLRTYPPVVWSADQARLLDWPAARTPWPLPNVWLGVSVETQKWADIRIPALLDTPAAVRFLSCEPLLSSVDLSPWLRGRNGAKRSGDPLACGTWCPECGQRRSYLAASGDDARIGHRWPGSSVRESTSGHRAISDGRQLPARPGDDRRTARDSAGAPNRLDGLEPADNPRVSR